MRALHQQSAKQLLPLVATLLISKQGWCFVISLAMLLSQGWSDSSQTSFPHRRGLRGWVRAEQCLHWRLWWWFQSLALNDTKWVTFAPSPCPSSGWTWAAQRHVLGLARGLSICRQWGWHSPRSGQPRSWLGFPLHGHCCRDCRSLLRSLNIRVLGS